MEAQEIVNEDLRVGASRWRAVKLAEGPVKRAWQECKGDRDAVYRREVYAKAVRDFDQWERLYHSASKSKIKLVDALTGHYENKGGNDERIALAKSEAGGS